MSVDQCPFRSLNSSGKPVCAVVSQLTELPLEICETNDSTCEFCLKCDVAPQVPNRATASMAMHACGRAGITASRQVQSGLAVHVIPPVTLENTPCVYRNQQIREQPCKPCQAGSRVPVNVPVYRCNSGKHSECTLKNTGAVPKIQACSTCEDRLPKYEAIAQVEYPSEVLSQAGLAILNQPPPQSVTHKH